MNNVCLSLISRAEVAMKFHIKSGGCSLRVYKSTKALKLMERERI